MYKTLAAYLVCDGSCETCLSDQINILSIQEYRHASTDRHPCSNRVLRNVALLGPPDIADTPEDPPEKQKSVRVAWV